MPPNGSPGPPAAGVVCWVRKELFIPPQRRSLQYRGREASTDPLLGIVPWTMRDSPSTPPCSMTRFLGSLRARLTLLHPSPNCSLRAESLVHVHFKEEIGVAELIPLVTTYIILFAYIYFSTRRSRQGSWAFPGQTGISRSLAPLPLKVAWAEMWNLPHGHGSQGFVPSSVSGAWVGPGLLWLLRKRPFLG